MVLGRARRATAAAAGEAGEQKDNLGTLGLCSILENAGLKDDTATAEAMELVSILAMQAFSPSAGQASDLRPEPKTYRNGFGRVDALASSTGS